MLTNSEMWAGSGDIWYLVRQFVQTFLWVVGIHERICTVVFSLYLHWRVLSFQRVCWVQDSLDIPPIERIQWKSFNKVEPFTYPLSYSFTGSQWNSGTHKTLYRVLNLYNFILSWRGDNILHYCAELPAHLLVGELAYL